MSEKDYCCPICDIVNEYFDEIKNCETEEELKSSIRDMVQASFDSGYKEFLIQDIAENIKFLEYLENKDKQEESDGKPNLKVVDNVKLN